MGNLDTVHCQLRGDVLSRKPFSMFSRPAALCYYSSALRSLTGSQQVDVVFGKTQILVRRRWLPFDSRTRFMREINELANDVLYMRA